MGIKKSSGGGSELAFIAIIKLSLNRKFICFWETLEGGKWLNLFIRRSLIRNKSNWELIFSMIIKISIILSLEMQLKEFWGLRRRIIVKI